MTKAKYTLTPDDHRHGTHAGYVAGCCCTPCGDARRRFQKHYQLRLLAGERIRYSPEEVDKITRRWLRMGFSQTAIQVAAGLSAGHSFLGTTVKGSTYRALGAITEDAFDDTAFCYSDLTKRRIHSMMAAGHQLKDMPITDRGQWRTRDRITCGVARAVRDFYSAHEFQIGPSKITASRARNAGHPVPLAWDDPGTIAWPTGKPGPITPKSSSRTHNDLDEVVVCRRLAGDQTIPTTYAERCAIVRSAHARGLNDIEISGLTGLSDRTVLRVRQALDLAATVDAGRNPIRRDGAA